MKEITAEKLQERIENGEELHMIDVREADEVAEGIIPGAVHIPLGEVAERVNELDKSKAYVIICRSGGRSGKATDFLEEQGYDATNMVGGMLDWDGATE